MCLVGIKPSGVEMNNSVIELIAGTAARYRSGIGYAYKRAGENVVYFSKSLNYRPDNLGEEISNLNLGDNDEIIWHGRAATHGETSDSNSHPYIIGEKTFGKHNNLLTTQGSVAINNSDGFRGVFMHNGIFSGYKTYNHKMSDTYNYGISVLDNPEVIALIKENPEEYGRLFAKYGWAKLAFLFPDVGIRYTTNDSPWIVDSDTGCIFSNGGYGKSRLFDIGGKLMLQD